MSINKLAKSKPGPSTVKYLDIAEIRDDLVLLTDGTVRAVLLVSSINFALKSVDEQEAIIQAYMTLLNSLTYSVQIVIQSRKMNIETYLDSLKQHQKSTSNELLKVQIEDYRAFVSELVELGDIMQKRFYIVITYDPASDKKKNFWTRASEVFSPASAAHLNRKQLVNRIEQISRRVANIESQLNSMSITSVRLDTQGLIELYYNVYNPDAFDREPMTDVSKIMHDDESALKNES